MWWVIGIASFALILVAGAVYWEFVMAPAIEKDLKSLFYGNER